jgi:hypothetical protein
MVAGGRGRALENMPQNGILVTDACLAWSHCFHAAIFWEMRLLVFLQIFRGGRDLRVGSV